MSKDRPVFIYAFLKYVATAYYDRADRNGILLFTCPESWKPKNQEEFEAAAKFYQIPNAAAIRYEADEDVPF